MSGGMTALLAAGTLLALAGGALAQTVTPPPEAAPSDAAPQGPVQTAPVGDVPTPRSDGVPVLTVAPSAAEPAAQANPPADAATSNTDRILVDTRVSDVRVGDEVTVATMTQSMQSACPSNEYVFERNRPKWLFQTGRLLQAMKEGAVVRISFTCLQGYQSINAIQFLSPPQNALAQETPRPGNVVRVAPQPAAAQTDLLPPPTPFGAAEDLIEQRVRQITTP
jgi:hypothetical protein